MRRVLPAGRAIPVRARGKGEEPLRRAGGVRGEIEPEQARGGMGLGLHHGAVRAVQELGGPDVLGERADGGGAVGGGVVEDERIGLPRRGPPARRQAL